MLQEIHSISILLRVQESILHFPRVQLSDSSNYVCIASNSLGEDRKKLKLKITSEVIVFVRPQKQVSTISNRANIKIQNAETFSFHKIISYQIQIRSFEFL